MHLSITGRHVEVTDAIKDYLEKRTGKVRRHFDQIINIHVILSIEKGRHLAEMTLQGNNFVFNGHEETRDMYTSIDSVVDKIEKQVKRYKDRISDHHKASSDRQTSQEETIIDEGRPDEDELGPRIIKTDRFAMKPMLPEEAALQIEVLEEDFLVFSNALTERINVLYRRKDGNFGLIEP